MRHSGNSVWTFLVSALSDV